MSKHTLITGISKEMHGLYPAIQEFKINQVILLTTKGSEDFTEQAINDLKRMNISVVTKKIEDPWSDTYHLINSKKEENLLINTCSGPDELKKALLSAAHTHGVKAYTLKNDEIFIIPIFQDYHKSLGDKKIEILNLLKEAPNNELNLEIISKKTKMSLPLISYHINGNTKSQGLKELNLITSREEKGRSYIKITQTGEILIK